MDLETLSLFDLTADEKEALSSYKTASEDANGQSRCFELNRQLERSLFPDEMGDLGKRVTALDGIFERCPKLTTPITVFRGTGFRKHMPVSERDSQFRNLSFWSTTRVREVAINFLNPAGPSSYGALFELELPVGTSCYNMETLDGSGGHESELLLPRGILWTVGDFTIFDKTQLLPHVAKQFENVFEVKMKAAAGFRIR